MGDESSEECGAGSPSIACRLRLHPVERLCTTLKPPPFPGWLNDSEVEHFKRDCSSWRAYEETPPVSSTTWIAPGIAFSASAILIIGTIITYIWHNKYRSKYRVGRLQYHSYPNSQGANGEKVESYSVTIISSGKVDEIVECGNHETSINSDDEEKHEPLKEPDITSEHEKFDTPDLSPDKDYSSLFVLPNVVPYQDIVVHDKTLDHKELKNLAKSESSEPIQPGGRVYEVGYVNPAYDGNDSLNEGRSPKKKKKKPKLFFGDKKAATKHRRF